MLLKSIKNLQDLFQRKGRERLTIMFIPHEKQQIFSIHISWMIIIFSTSIFLALVLLTTFSIYRKYKQRSEKEKIFNLYSSKVKLAIRLEKNTENNITEYNRLIERLDNIASIINISQLKIKSLKQQKEIIQNKNIENKDEISHRNNSLRLSILINDLYKDSKTKLPFLAKINFWSNSGFGVYKMMPMGRPFKSFNSLRDTSKFGYRTNPISKSGREFHGGHDTAGPIGTVIYATAPGTVIKSHYAPNGYGKRIVIKHPFGLYSAYAHLRQIFIATGQQIQKGERIASMGNSGRTTGPHLHYEIHLGLQNRINPLPYICGTDFYTNSCLRYHDR